jgi:hypothetical protein
MPRAKPFSRSDVLQRSKELQLDPVLIEKLVRRANVTDQAERERFRYKLRCTIEAYRARVCADKQESPASIVAALEPGLKAAKDLLEWRNSLPVGVLTELQEGNIQIEAVVATIENRVTYWQKHVAAHRPASDASLDLRRSLIDIMAAHRPAPPDATNQQKRSKEQRRRDWVAFACSEIGAKYPHQKKHRRRFVGEHKQKPPSDVKAQAKAKPSKRRERSRIRKSEAERRLKAVPI